MQTATLSCALQILAKMESRVSLFNFQAIAVASDGIIMSRGNLGLDVVPEKMALIQKSIISNCNILVWRRHRTGHPL